MKRESPPHPRKRNPGGFRNSPRTPLKRPDQGGLRAPLFWTSSPRGRGSGSGARGEDCPRPSRVNTKAAKCGEALTRRKSIAHPAEDYRTLSAFLTNNSRNKQSRSPFGHRLCGIKAFSFGPCTARFLCRKQRKWGVQNSLCYEIAQKNRLCRSTACFRYSKTQLAGSLSYRPSEG